VGLVKLNIAARVFQVGFALVLLAVSRAAGAAPPNPPAATPVFQSTVPAGLVADVSYPQVDTLELFGQNLTLPTTTGYTVNTDVSLWVRWVDGSPHKPDNAWHKCVSDRTMWCFFSGWTRNEYIVSLAGLDHGTMLQFAVSVGGSAWAYDDVLVNNLSTTVPTFGSKSYSVPCLATSVSSSDSRRSLYFTAAPLDSTDQFYVNGFGFDDHFGRLVAFEGWGEVWIPASVQANCGSQQLIWIENTVGWSSPVTLTVGN
jgi:hypothetical protein